MNNIQIAQDTMAIIKDMKYTYQGREIELPQMDFAAVKVYSPEDGKGLCEKYEKSIKKEAEKREMCRIVITTEDSYQAASRYSDCMVMNFANAHKPGGGFIFGATAQEEALCRCSTLYESINSEAASEMYKYNNTHMSKVESDYMLYSDVCVFRDNRCNLIAEPFVTSVITVPAPNRIGAAMFISDKKADETMIRRIRILSLIAHENGRKNLVLGAWGCGAFHNDPKNVSECFRKVIVDEGLGRLFDDVCFAIYGGENGKNITAFRECFKE